MAKFVMYVGLASAVGLVGCGGTQPQPTMMGAGMDPLASSGSLGTGTTKGNAAKKQPDLGVDSNLNGFKVFDDGSFWNKDVEKSPVDPNSAKTIAAIGADKTLSASFGSSGPDKLPFGTPYVVVSSDAPRVAITFAQAKGSDEGPYPFPLQMPIEPGKDAHAIVIDRDQQKLYETSGTKLDGTTFKADAGAIWDLRTYVARKSTQVAADPSGLPAFPGLVRFEEASDPKGINHVLRFTLAKVGKSFVAPALSSVQETVNVGKMSPLRSPMLATSPVGNATTPNPPPTTLSPAVQEPAHAGAYYQDGLVKPPTTLSPAAQEPELPPMGLHLRLKKSVNISKFPTTVQPILAALKKYGMILSDTGSDFGLSGSPDSKWIDSDLASLKNLKVSDFEVLTPPPPPKSTKKSGSTASSTPASNAATSSAVASPVGVSTPNPTVSPLGQKTGS